MKGLVSLASLLLLPGVLLAARPQDAQASAPDHLLTGYVLTSWTDGDGVPLGTVYAIGQDLDGYLWLGTDAGLLRFDRVEGHLLLLDQVSLHVR